MRKTATIACSIWLEAVRRKDVYVLLILMAALLFALLSVDAFGMASTVRYILDLGLLLAWILSIILTVTLTGRQLPREEERGTIHSLLAKPISRIELLTGKWLGGWLASVACTAAFYLLLAAVIRLREGEFPPRIAAQAWLLHSAALAVMAAITLLYSTRFNFDATATLSFITLAFTMGMVPQIPELLTLDSGIRAQALFALYYLLPHFELFDLRRRLVHDWGALDPATLIGILLYAAALTLFFLTLAWLSYRKKTFTRGATL